MTTKVSSRSAAGTAATGAPGHVEATVSSAASPPEAADFATGITADDLPPSLSDEEFREFGFDPPGSLGFHNLPAELCARSQWVVWCRERRDGKLTKVPYAPTPQRGRRAAVDDRATWGTFADACAATAWADGLGFVFTVDDPFLGVDLDDCLDGNREVHPEVVRLVRLLDSYTERSPSGSGLHVIVNAGMVGDRHRTAETAWGGNIEFYDRARFFCMTGEIWLGTPPRVEARQEQLARVIQSSLGPVKEGRVSEPDPLSEDAPEVLARARAIPDAELLERARTAQNGAKYEALWRGSIEGYGSPSEADLALCSLLAFWTGPDRERIDRLYRESALYREKWERDDYRERTLRLATEPGRTYYEWPAPEPEPDGALGDITPFTVFTARELCSLPDPPQSDALLGPLVVRGQRTVIGAATGEGKTTFVHALLKAIVNGEAFLDYAGTGGRALFIDAEQGLKTEQRRLREVELDESDQLDVLRVPDGLSLNDARQAEQLEALFAAQDYAVVAADPLYKLHTGDSNNEREAIDLMRRFDAWRERYRFALLLPVHLRKAPPEGAKLTLNEVFGSGAYTRGAEVVLGLKFVRKGYSRLHFLKDRDGDLPLGDRWGLLFDRTEGFRRDPKETGERLTTKELVRRALTATPGMTTGELEEVTKKSERSVREALKKLHATEKGGEGKAGGGRVDKRFCLPKDELWEEPDDNPTF